MTVDLCDYLFVDEAKVDSYINQLGGMPPRISKQTRKIAFSLTNPSFETSNEVSTLGENLHDKIVFLRAKMLTTNNITIGRPIQAPEPGDSINRFVLETTEAKAVVIPGKRLPEELRVKFLKIWVADPDPKDLNGPPWSYRGSYLYLTELIYDDISFQSTLSGCSALRAIINMANGGELRDRGHQELYGRDDKRHPIEKLSEVGGIEIGSRRIETLYRIRYMTNEQLFSFAGENHRVHDILAYAIYISTT